jgi:hypothetical protein
LEPVLSTLLLSRFIRFHQEAIMGAFIGLDVSLSKTAVCVVDRDGAVLWQGNVPSEPGPLIARWAEWLVGLDRSRWYRGVPAVGMAAPRAAGSRHTGSTPDRSTIRQSLALLADAIDWSNAVVPGFRPVLVKRASK